VADVFRRNLLYPGLVTLGILILSCLITMMVTFISFGTPGADVQTLFAAQAVAAPVALLIVIFDLAMYAKTVGWRNGLRTIWSAAPAWLVLALVLLNSLVLIGELSYLLLIHLTAQAVPWVSHAQLLCMLTCSAAFCALYSRRVAQDGKVPAPVGRWP